MSTYDVLARHANLMFVHYVTKSQTIGLQNGVLRIILEKGFVCASANLNLNHLSTPSCPWFIKYYTVIILKGTDHVGTFMGLKCVVYYANYRSGNQSSKIQVVP